MNNTTATQSTATTCAHVFGALECANRFHFVARCVFCREVRLTPAPITGA